MSARQAKEFPEDWLSWKITVAKAIYWALWSLLLSVVALDHLTFQPWGWAAIIAAMLIAVPLAVVTPIVRVIYWWVWPWT
jgi:hypothetical protein